VKLSSLTLQAYPQLRTRLIAALQRTDFPFYSQALPYCSSLAKRPVYAALHNGMAGFATFSPQFDG
jgi:hypothetical protein